MNRIRRYIVWENNSTIKQTIYKIDKNKAQKRSIGRYTVRKGYKIRGQQDSHLTSEWTRTEMSSVFILQQSVS